MPPAIQRRMSVSAVGFGWSMLLSIFFVSVASLSTAHKRGAPAARVDSVATEAVLRKSRREDLMVWLGPKQIGDRRSSSLLGEPLCADRPNLRHNNVAMKPG